MWIGYGYTERLLKIDDFFFLSEKRIYRHWSDEDTSVIYKYFQRFIENIGAYSNNKGPLPGRYSLLLMFLT